MPEPADAMTRKTFHSLTVGVKGLVARIRGDEPAARDAFTNARNELEQTVASINPTTHQALCALGVVDAALGNKEDAIREGERAVELMPVSKSAIEGPMLIAISGRHLCVDGRQGPRN